MTPPDVVVWAHHLQMLAQWRDVGLAAGEIEVHVRALAQVDCGEFRTARQVQVRHLAAAEQVEEAKWRSFQVNLPVKYRNMLYTVEIDQNE